MLSVYISNRNIKAVSGAGGAKGIKLKSAVSKPLPEGIIINGIIIDEPALSDAVTELWAEYRLPRRGIRLILDSSQIFIRILTIPLLPDKQCVETLKNEYALNESTANMLYDYRVLEINKKIRKQTVMGISLDADMIKAYAELFRKSGVSLSSVSVSVCGALDVMRLIPGMADATCIFSVLDGNTTSTIFTVNGKYRYSTRARLFSDPGTPEFITEIGQNFNKIIQFHASEKIESPISGIFIAGVPQRHIRDLCDGIYAELGIRVKPLPELDAVKLPPPEKMRSDGSDEPLTLGELIYPAGNLASK